MDKEILQDLVSKNKSIKDMAKILNMSPSSVRRWLKKYGLKTTFIRNIVDKNVLQTYS